MTRKVTDTNNNINSYTDIRTAADELLKYVSYASLRDTLESKSALSERVSGDDIASGRLCELLLGNGQPVPDYDLMIKKINLLNLSAATDSTGQSVKSGLKTSFFYPAESSTIPTLKNKKISTVYHEAQGKVDFSASFSDISALFCSMIPSTEMALCTPYFDVKIIYAQESSGIGQLSALRFVGHKPSVTNGEKSAGGALLQGYTSLDPVVRAGFDVAGMEIFCLPATLSMMSSQLNSQDSVYDRGVFALDSTSPLLSIESASIQQVGLDGSLYAQTKVDLRMILHDRSRLSEISTLVSSEIFPTVSFRITYGWSHPDTNKMTGSVYAKLLNTMRITQDFVVSSSKISSKDAMSLSIDLSLVSRGAQGVSGSKLITAGGQYIPFTALLSLIKQFVGLKTNSSNQPSANFSKIGSTIVSNASSGASKNSYIKIDDYYDLYEKVLGIVGKDALATELQIQEIVNRLNDLQQNGGIYSPTSQDFNQVLEFLYPEPQPFVYAQNIPSSFDYQESLGVSDDSFIATKVKEICKQISIDYSDVWNYKHTFAPVVPLSAAVAKMVAKPLLLSNPDIDEVRIHCFSFSSGCGEMAEQNIGDFPIIIENLKPRKVGKDEIEGVTSRSSANSALKFIMRQPNDPASPFFGLNKELIQRAEIKKKYAELTGQAAEAAQAQMDTELDVNQELIDGKNREILALKGIKFQEGSYVPARIKYQIDVLDCVSEADENANKLAPDVNVKKKKIARIMIYDERSGAFNKLANLLFSMINANGLATMSRDSASIPEEAITAITSAGTIDSFLKIIDEERTTQQDLITFAMSNKFKARQIMSNAYPVLALGTDGGVIKNATFSSQPSGEVQSSYLFTALKEGGGGSKLGDNPESSLLADVLILPTNVTVSMLGNVLITRGQTYFVDFNTGTTLDNSYTVTSVSHTIRQGSFETSAVLAPTNSVSMRSTYRQLQDLVALVKQTKGDLITSQDL